MSELLPSCENKGEITDEAKRQIGETSLFAANREQSPVEVGIGNIVGLVVDGELERYIIVDEPVDIGDPYITDITPKSPIGKALIGKGLNQVIRWQTPNGVVLEGEIIEIN